MSLECGKMDIGRPFPSLVTASTQEETGVPARDQCCAGTWHHLADSHINVRAITSQTSYLVVRQCRGRCSALKFQRVGVRDDMARRAEKSYTCGDLPRRTLYRTTAVACHFSAMAFRGRPIESPLSRQLTFWPLLVAIVLPSLRRPRHLSHARHVTVV